MLSLLLLCYSIGFLWNRYILPQKVIFEFREFNINWSFEFKGEIHIRNFSEKGGNKLSGRGGGGFGLKIIPLFNEKRKGINFYIENSLFYKKNDDRLIADTLTFGIFYNIPFSSKENTLNFRIELSPFFRFLWYNSRSINEEKDNQIQKTDKKFFNFNFGKGRVRFLLFFLL